ncbi:MAG: hypothetical protein MUO82_03660 [Candidatus Thermoplasmatota archaeon]|nr:hypothetical protein [Candidatus Thermoplasmatota archaeon]
MPDLIEEHFKITREFTDAPEIFLKTCSYHIISTVLGQYFEIFDSHVKRPNLWFILSSVPGITRRSTVCGFNEDVISRAFTKFYADNEKLAGKEAYSKYSSSRIVDGTPEGIEDAVMDGEAVGINTFNVCNPEIGDVLRKISTGKSGTYGLDTLLSRLYYGEPYIDYLSRRVKNARDRKFSAGKYVTMFSSMQEPQYYLNKTMSRQGLLRRMQLIYVDTKDLKKENWKSPFCNNLHSYQKEMEDYVDDLLFPTMLEFYNAWKNYNEDLNDTHYIPVKIEDTVNKKIEKVAYEIDMKIIDNASDYNIYQQSRWENLIKMTAVSAIARNPLEGKEKVNVWSISATYDDYQRAKNILLETGKHMEKVLDQLGTCEIQAKEDKGIDRVYQHIYSTGEKGIKRSDLSNNTHIKAKDLQEYITTLVQSEKIKVIIKETASKPLVIYIATCFMAQI